MTLRDFTDKYAPLPDARFTENNVVWRKVFPTNLRWHKIVDKPYKRITSTSIFFQDRYREEESHLELEQEWERVHKGEIIDTEWRKLYTY